MFKLTIVKGKSNVKFCCSDVFNVYFEYVQSIDLRNTIYNIKCDALSRLVSFVPFKKRDLLKVTILHGRFSCFLNCANDTKSLNTSQILEPEAYTEPSHLSKDGNFR